MANTDVIDTVQSIEKWAAAFELLQKWDSEGCSDCVCEMCGFKKVCPEAVNLVK